jgi:RNA polymerase sigma factor (sigma-70 family)
MEAVRDFDASRNIHFAAFLQSRLHGAIYKAFKQACSYSQHTAHPTTPEAAENADYFDMQESPRPTPEQKALARAELAAILAKLTKQEKSLLQLLYVENMPQKTIAQPLHLSPQAVSKRKQNLIAKIKKLA